MKKLLIGRGGSLVVLVIVVAVAAPFFIPVDTYKNELVAAVKAINRPRPANQWEGVVLAAAEPRARGQRRRLRQPARRQHPANGKARQAPGAAEAPAAAQPARRGRPAGAGRSRHRARGRQAGNAQLAVRPRRAGRRDAGAPGPAGDTGRLRRRHHAVRHHPRRCPPGERPDQLSRPAQGRETGDRPDRGEAVAR